jgi:hypothetical protein
MKKKGQRPPSGVEILRWVAANLDEATSRADRPELAPCTEAWNLLKHCRASSDNRDDFWKTYMSKMVNSKDLSKFDEDDEDERIDGQQTVNVIDILSRRMAEQKDREAGEG